MLHFLYFKDLHVVLPILSVASSLIQAVLNFGMRIAAAINSGSLYTLPKWRRRWKKPSHLDFRFSLEDADRLGDRAHSGVVLFDESELNRMDSVREKTNHCFTIMHENCTQKSLTYKTYKARFYSTLCMNQF